MRVSFQVVFDCANPDKLAHFWAFALNYKLQDPPLGYATWQDFLVAHHYSPETWEAASAIVDPLGVGPRLFFQKVPEAKVVKNRVHLDINSDGSHDILLDERKNLVDAQVERLIAEGATKLATQEQHNEFWVVMADPEGNEFCVQ